MPWNLRTEKEEGSYAIGYLWTLWRTLHTYYDTVDTLVAILQVTSKPGFRAYSESRFH